MDKIRSLRRIIYILAAIFAVQMVFVAFMLRPLTLIKWVSIGVLAVVAVYLIAIGLKLLQKVKEENLN